MKRIVFALVISLSAVSVMAQSEQSNVIFAQGVELYKAGNYEAAIPFFLRCDSIDKAELGERHYRADYGRIWLASCYYQLGDEKKAKDIRPGILTLSVKENEPVLQMRLLSGSALNVRPADVFAMLAERVSEDRICAARIIRKEIYGEKDGTFVPLLALGTEDGVF